MASPSSGLKNILLVAGLGLLALVVWLVASRTQPPPPPAAPVSALPSTLARLTPGAAVGAAKVVRQLPGSNGTQRVELETASGRKVTVEVSGGVGSWSLALVLDGGAITVEDAQLVSELSSALEEPVDAGSAQPARPNGAPLANAPVFTGPTTSVHIIPSGQEEQLSNMLGKGVELPGGCRWGGAAIERTIITSRYTCGTANHVVTLCHPEDPCPQPATVTTKVFALSSDLPAPAFEALVARLGAEEASFRWEVAVSGGGGTAPFLPPGMPFPWVAFAAGAGAIFLAVLTLLTARWRLTRGGSPWAERSAGARLALSCFAALLWCWSAQQLLRTSGDLLWATLKNTVQSGSLHFFGDLAFLALVAGVAGAVFSSVRASGPAVLRLLGAAVLFLCLAWPASLPREPLHLFGKLSNHPPGSMPYPMNTLGFRGAEWPEKKPAGTLRLGLIGDSFVEGSGLDREEDTLSAQLAEELRRRYPNTQLEVLNLGIGGDNLISHVDLVEEAAERLGLDVVVLCLTLPNDLSPWDSQVERRDVRRLSAFSFTRMLIGETASLIFLRRNEPLAGEQSSAFVSAELTRLGQVQARWTGGRALLVFSFHRPEPELTPLLRAIPGSTLVVPPPMEQQDFIPGDGHPTGAGNRKFAGAIADGLAVDPRARALLPAAAP